MRRSSHVRAILRRFPPAGWLRRLAKGWRFRGEFRQFRSLSERRPPRFDLRWSERLPCLDDRTATTPFDRHYVYHAAWAARALADTRPERHVDISSTLFFCGIVSAFVPVDFYDYRPADLHLDNLVSGRADLLSLPFADASVRSLSCMHVVEHLGLGRYGDSLDPDGDRRAMAELSRVLAPGGTLLFVVPVGRARIQFNAHRIYSYEQVLEGFSSLDLREFALIPDRPEEGGLIRNAVPESVRTQRYACGCFQFTRRR